MIVFRVTKANNSNFWDSKATATCPKYRQHELGNTDFLILPSIAPLLILFLMQQVNLKKHILVKPTLTLIIDFAILELFQFHINPEKIISTTYEQQQEKRLL